MTIGGDVGDMVDTVIRYSIINGTVEEVTAAGGKNIQSAKHTGIIFAELTEEQAAQLTEMGMVVSHVDKVRMTGIAPPPPITGVATYTPQDLLALTGLDALRQITTPPLYGDGVNIAVIGTGILATHELISPRVVYMKNYTTAPNGDSFNHDTGVASIILAVAPNCNLLDLKVIDSRGEGSEEDVVFAIDDCMELNDTGADYAPSIINLSLGGDDDNDPNDPIRLSCRAAINAGITVFAAAGNSGPDPQTIVSPACEQYVIAVGSIAYFPDSRTFTVSGYSSRGPTLAGLTKPDVALFGENIIMASSLSDTATIAKSGTSFSCPMAAGMGVLYVQGLAINAEIDLGKLPQSLLPSIPISTLVNSYIPKVCLKPMGVAAGKDNNYGCGLPFGPLAEQALAPTNNTDMNSVLNSVLPALVMLPMMAMAMKMTTSKK